MGICWVLWLCFIFFYHKSPVHTYFLSQKDQSNTHQHVAVRYQWCKGCVRFVFAIADKIMKTLYITMLIMEIYSSLRRKNVKSEDSRYHHPKHNRWSIESCCFGFYLKILYKYMCYNIWFYAGWRNTISVNMDYATVLFLQLFIYIIPKICHSVWYHYTVTFLCMHMRLLTVVVCILTRLGMPRQGRYLKRLAAKT